MSNDKRFSLSLVLGLFFVAVGSHPAGAQTPLKTINNAQDGEIVYGLVDGATTPAMAMARILHHVQNTCGEKPQVGKVFRVRGTNSDAVFLTAVNHSMGNKQRAGLLIAAPAGPHQVEIGLVMDEATRFASTMNPLQRQLFSVWHPGGEAAPAGIASVGSGGALPPMHTVSLSDSTAAVNLPDGWNFGPRSGGGTALVMGPQGEAIDLNWYLLVQDPRAPDYQRQMRMGIKPLPSIHIFCPYNPNLTTAFPDIYLRMQAAAGLGTAPPKIDSIKPVEGTQGQCVDATGQVNLGDKGMKEFRELMCGTPPTQNYWRGTDYAP